MGLYNNLEPALQHIIQEHSIRIINNRSFFRGDADHVFYYLQVGFYKEGLKKAGENLEFDRRFTDTDGHYTPAGLAIASYIIDRYKRPDVVEDDGLMPHEDESGCVVM